MPNPRKRRTPSDDVVRRKVLRMLKKRDTLYYEDVAGELGIDIKQAKRVLDAIGTKEIMEVAR